MRICEQFLDRIAKTKLYNATLKQENFMEFWASNSKRIWLNFIKIKILDSPQTNEFWKTRIDAHIQDLMLKGCILHDKPITQKQMYEYFFESCWFTPEARQIPYQIKILELKTSKKLQLLDYDPQEVHDDIIKIMKSVFNKMYNKTFVSIREFLC